MSDYKKVTDENGVNPTKMDGVTAWAVEYINKGGSWFYVEENFSTCGHLPSYALFSYKEDAESVADHFLLGKVVSGSMVTKVRLWEVALCGRVIREKT